MKIIAFMLLFQGFTFSQVSLDALVTAGAGMISSNSPYISGFTTSLSLGMGKNYDNITPRVSFYYSGDFNRLLPASDRTYYPHIYALAAKGVYAIPVSGDIYYEQSLGIIAANDQVFSTSSGWGLGFIIGIVGGADLRGSANSGFRIGIGGEYGLTVISNYVRYGGLFLQAQYIFY